MALKKVCKLESIEYILKSDRGASRSLGHFSALAAAVGAQFCHRTDAHPLKVTTGRLQFSSCNNFFSASTSVSAIFEVVDTNN